MNCVKGKVVIVTGAGNGIGRASCELMAKAGAQVVATDINLSAAQGTVSAIVKSGGDAIAIKHDVASESDWQQVLALTLEHFKKLDVIVNNAGIDVPGAGELKNASMEDWQKVIGINMGSVFLGTRLAINTMENNEKGGAVINVSSIAGFIDGHSSVIYSASKGGVRAFTKVAASECKRKGYNIRINSICPGGVDTPASRSGASEAVNAHIDKLVESGVLCKAHDIAKGVLYLASDDSSFITGSELVIDGGLSASIFNENFKDEKNWQD